MKTTKATIEVRTVGQAHGCEGVVSVRGKQIATTRVYPHGQRANAYEAAEALAVERGYSVEVAS